MDELVKQGLTGRDYIHRATMSEMFTACLVKSLGVIYMKDRIVYFLSKWWETAWEIEMMDLFVIRLATIYS